MKPTYAVFFAHVFSERDWRRFGCDYFEQNGFNVFAVEFFTFIRPDHMTEDDYGHLTRFERAIRVENSEQLNHVLDRLGPDPVILNLLPQSPELRSVFEALAEREMHWGTETMGKIPVSLRKYHKVHLGLADYLARMTTDVLSRASRTKAYLAARLGAKGDTPAACFTPDWWLDAGDFDDGFAAGSDLARQTKRISSRSFDLETANAVAGADPAPDAVPPYAVFLDDGFLGQSDFRLLGMSAPVTPERYAARLRQLFRTIESRFGLDIRIAVHPKSMRPDIARHLADWPADAGRTPALVKRARFVIAHCSTSISFAVAFEKPVLFATTDELERHPYCGILTARMSSWLGSRRVNIDDDDNLHDLNEPTMDTDAYAAYKSAFLLSPAAADISVWSALEAALSKEPQATCGAGGRQDASMRPSHP
jgi:hypothetical protein